MNTSGIYIRMKVQCSNNCIRQTEVYEWMQDSTTTMDAHILSVVKNPTYQVFNSKSNVNGFLGVH